MMNDFLNMSAASERMKSERRESKLFPDDDEGAEQRAKANFIISRAAIKVLFQVA